MNALPSSASGLSLFHAVPVLAYLMVTAVAAAEPPRRAVMEAGVAEGEAVGPRSAALGQIVSAGVAVKGLAVPAGTTLQSGSLLKTGSTPAIIHLRGGAVLRVAGESSARFSQSSSGAVEIDLRSGNITMRKAEEGPPLTVTHRRPITLAWNRLAQPTGAGSGTRRAGGVAPDVKPRQHIARVVEAEGLVTKNRGADSEVKLVKRGTTVTHSLLRSGDTLETGPQSRAVLTYSNGDRFEVLSETRVVIPEISVAPTAARPELGIGHRLELAFGRLLAWITKDSKVGTEIVAPSAVAAVKGTAFEVSVRPEDGKSTLSISEGTVEFRNQDFKVNTRGAVGDSVSFLAADESLRIEVPETAPRPLQIEVAGQTWSAGPGTVLTVNALGVVATSALAVSVTTSTGAVSTGAASAGATSGAIAAGVAAAATAAFAVTELDDDAPPASPVTPNS